MHAIFIPIVLLIFMNVIFTDDGSKTRDRRYRRHEEDEEDEDSEKMKKKMDEVKWM